MEQDEFDELKEDVQEVFEDDVEITILYRQLNDSSVTNERFGIVETEATDDTPLLCSVLINPDQKVRKKLGVSEEARALLTIPTLELETKAVVLEREKGWFEYEGKRYEILRIDPRPHMFNSSIVVRIELGKEKPVKD